MSGRRWSLVVSALLGGALGMIYAAWPTIRHGHAVQYSVLLWCAAIGAAAFVTLALLRNAFSS